MHSVYRLSHTVCQSALDNPPRECDLVFMFRNWDTAVSWIPSGRMVLFKKYEYLASFASETRVESKFVAF